MSSFEKTNLVQLRAIYCAENLAVIRHLTLNLLTQKKSAKGGTRAKRFKAGWDDRYLTKILAQVPTPSRKL